MRMIICFRDKSMHEAWKDGCNHDEWEQSFLWITERSRLIFVLSLSSCERGVF